MRGSAQRGKGCVQLLGGHKIRVHGCIYGTYTPSLAIQTQDKAPSLVCGRAYTYEKERVSRAAAPTPLFFQKRDKFITQNFQAPIYPPPPPPYSAELPRSDFLPKSGNYLFFMLLCVRRMLLHCGCAVELQWPKYQKVFGYTPPDEDTWARTHIQLAMHVSNPLLQFFFFFGFLSTYSLFVMRTDTR